MLDDPKAEARRRANARYRARMQGNAAHRERMRVQALERRQSETWDAEVLNRAFALLARLPRPEGP